MFNMRAYVVSIVAIFLALGIGILLGTVIIDKETLLKQQNLLLEDVRKDVKHVIEDNRKLKEQASGFSSFEKKIFPVVVKDKLIGKTIAVMQSPSVNDKNTKFVFDTINRASGKYFVIKISSDSYGEKTIVNKKIRKLTTTSASSDNQNLLFGTLGRSVAIPDSNPSLKMMSRTGLLSVISDKKEIKDLDKAIPNSVAIIISSKDKENLDKFYSPLIEELKQYNISIVAVEIYDDEPTVVNLKKLQITTIDNINEVSGQISLTYGLNGEIGSFGRKTGVDSIMPNLDEQILR